MCFSAVFAGSLVCHPLARVRLLASAACSLPPAHTLAAAIFIARAAPEQNPNLKITKLTLRI
ncbi:hypothetical protein [Methanimicrococcus blatticola]|uniref:hypothetical protein n=1 Tax=Methanimicrococcus blatticola TaxID=91560 RepID=UPI00105C5EEE|nr:hypothetical protein [Methanimicrococcus blatticola]MBZ3934899.1 hypothetical protein [Methanimicrococcus blatticola]MCC2509002.1 hypothetical protein [Methanimicrococcus blatticola]